MARRIHTKIGCVNVVTHPHTPENYVNLFNRIFESRIDVSIGHQQRMIMGALQPGVIEQQNALTGFLYKFLDVGGDNAWYNIALNEEASDEDLREINIPRHLRPNLTKHRFVFFPDGHKLFIQVKGEHQNDNVSMNQVEKYLQRVCSKEFIIEEFGEVFLTVIPNSEDVEQMLASDAITAISYEITLPNPDYDDEDQYVGWMESQGIYKEQRALKAQRGGRVEPNSELKSLAITASRNGNLQVKEKDTNGITVTKTSSSSPMIESVSFDPSVETATNTFWNKSLQLLRSLLT
ncbi:MAG: DUF4747 family protein [Thiomicrospira sp.]